MTELEQALNQGAFPNSDDEGEVIDAASSEYTEPVFFDGGTLAA